MGENTKKNDYKATLNLPQTAFSMKADLVNREPGFLKSWDRIGVYERLRELRKGGPRFLLHDGPPYASGDIHIGTGLNKVLKDLIVRYKSMTGFDAPYVPGWDCHGLPIEHKVMTELGEKARTMDKMEIRRRCRTYALKYVERHKQQFRQLGGIGAWDAPYLTINPQYEAGVIEVFADLVAKGNVYKSLKPIHWCMTCETALAEAELEYSDDDSPSIFVKFPMVDDLRDLFPNVGSLPVSVLIWTTPPWTLPANLAVAVHPMFEYAAVKVLRSTGVPPVANTGDTADTGVPSVANTGDTADTGVPPVANTGDTADTGGTPVLPAGKDEVLILAAELVDTVMKQAGIDSYEVLGKQKGSALEGRKYRHCLFDKLCPIVLAEYVALSDTGCVHTAPGHGEEDYRTGVKYGLEILSPVDSRGRYTDQAGDLKGMQVFQANPVVLERLKAKGLLLKSGTMKHSYPHCWRCKKPVIFRATEQWFVSMTQNDLREAALREIDNVQWIPDWGQTRIRGMVEQRPDWCISRQRAWGIPIPAFYCESCGETILDYKIVLAVRDLFAKKGSDSWFEMDASAILPPGYACPKCSGRKFRKETDIFDVWFESGSSHRSVCKLGGLGWPADLYLEGTDQHRGWFQLSLLTAVGADGHAPYKTVLTHGFVVDEKGQKMSKSLGNFISVEDVLKRFGGDIFRLWVSSVDYRQDVSLSFNLIEHLSNGYRRIRNTFRYLLGNLHGFDPAADRVDFGQMPEIDRWALSRAQSLLEQCRAAYDAYEFHRVFHLAHNFCAVDMSSFYLDILKDRVYTMPAKSLERRSALTAMCEILNVLIKALAPILVYTVEDAWKEARQYLGVAESPHLELMPEPRKEWIDTELEARWARLIQVRDEAARETEKLRNAGTIGSSMEASVTLCTEDPELLSLLKRYQKNLSEIFIVSEVTLADREPDGAVAGANLPALKVLARRSPYPKCQRCWNLRASVGADSKYPDLCDRCVVVVRG